MFSNKCVFSSNRVPVRSGNPVNALLNFLATTISDVYIPAEQHKVSRIIFTRAFFSMTTNEALPNNEKVVSSRIIRTKGGHR
jgi:hypothetical protein